MKLVAILLLLCLGGCDRLLAFGDPVPRVDAAVDGRIPDGGMPDLPGGASQPYSLLGLPAECGGPLFNIWNPPPAVHTLHVSARNGSDSNLGLDPPCPPASPCRQIGPLFERLVDAPDDHTMCDASAGKLYLKYLQPGDLILVEDGEYAPFEIRQACGTRERPIVIRATRNAVVRGAATSVDIEGPAWLSTVLLRLSRYVVLEGFKLVPPPDRRGLSLIYNTNVVVRRVEVQPSGLPVTTEAKVQPALVTTHLKDCVVEGCELHDSGWAGIEVGSGVRRVVFARNHLHDNDGAGFQTDPYQVLTSAVPELTPTPAMECNLFDGNILSSNHGPAMNLQSPKHVVVRNNLVHNGLGGGIALSPNAEAAPEDLLVANNTIDVSDGQRAIEVSNLAGTVTLRNNIIYGRKLAAIGLASGTNLDLLDSDYNALGAAAAPLVTIDASGSVIVFDLTAWRDLGKDAHSREAPIDSLVVQPSTSSPYDYHLKQPSEARGAGIFIPEKLGKTIEGKDRPDNSAVDLGCY